MSATKTKTKTAIREMSYIDFKGNLVSFEIGQELKGSQFVTSIELVQGFIYVVVNGETFAHINEGDETLKVFYTTPEEAERVKYAAYQKMEAA